MPPIICTCLKKIILNIRLNTGKWTNQRTSWVRCRHYQSPNSQQRMNMLHHRIFGISSYLVIMSPYISLRSKSNETTWTKSSKLFSYSYKVPKCKFTEVQWALDRTKIVILNHCCSRSFVKHDGLFEVLKAWQRFFTTTQNKTHMTDFPLDFPWILALQLELLFYFTDFTWKIMKTHANVSPSLNRDFSGKNWANQRGVAFRGARKMK